MNVRDKIHNNPYRILGVYVGSSVSLELRNKNKIVTFAKVGQQASFPLPIDGKLDAIVRSERLANEATRILALPKDRIENALFWVGDGNSDWSYELNEAVDALLTNNLLKAIYHYGNLIYNEELCKEFQQAVTHGLMRLSPDELTEMLYCNIINNEDELIVALKEADVDVKPNRLIRQLFGRSIIRNIDSIISFNGVIYYNSISRTNTIRLDFYISYNRLVAKIDELMPLVKIVARVYGEDSVMYAEVSERFACEVYEKASTIIQAIGKWTWVNDKNAVKNNERIKFISVRTRKSVETCMSLISSINDCVENAIDRLRLSTDSIRLVSPTIFRYKKVLMQEYISDENQIVKSVQSHRQNRLVGDIVWLGILAVVFLLV